MSSIEKRNRFPIKFRVDAETYDYLLLEQRALRERTLAPVIRRIIGERRALQEELASTISVTEGKDGTRRIIHTLLSAMEERMVRTIEQRANHLGSRLDRLFEKTELGNILTYQAYFGFLLHTPEVLDEIRAEAIQSARQRLEKYDQKVVSIARGGGLGLDDEDLLQ